MKKAPAPTGREAGGVGWLWSPAAAQALAAAWALGMAWRYYHEPGFAPPWRLWPAILPPVWEATGAALWRAAKLCGLLAWMILLGSGAGGFCLRRWGPGSGDRLGMRLAELAVGWGVMGLGMLGLGLLGLWNHALLLAILIGGSVALAAERWSRRAAEAPPRREAPPDAGRARLSWESVWLLILGLLAAFNLLAAFIPEIFFDSLMYHLALPDLYWLRGGIVATPENLHAGFPMLVQMLYAIALPLGGDGLCHLIHWALGIGTAAWIYCLGARLGSRGAAALAAALFYSIPLVGVMSWKAGVELGWAFFQLAAVYALVERLGGESDRRQTLLAGILCGLAMGTKYQAWPMLFVLVGALLACLPGSWRARENIREAGIFFAAAAASMAAWPLKNLVLYGNPIYPFLHEHFSSGPPVRWRLLVEAGGGRDIASIFTTWEGLRSWLAHPWQLVTLGGDVNSMGPVLLLGLPLILLPRFSAVPVRAMRLALIGLWGVWSLTSTLGRFLLPHAPLACLIMALALEEGFHPKLRAVLRVGALYVVVSNAFWVTSWLATYEAHGVILGAESRADYLRRPHPSYPRPPYAAIEYVNARLPADARVLFVGEARSFHCERDRICMNPSDEEPFRSWVARSPDAGALRDILRRQGITHVLWNVNELAVWQSRSTGYLRFEPSAAAVWNEFRSRHLRQVFEHKGPERSEFSWPWSVVFEIK